MTELENKIIELVTDNWRDKEIEANLTKLRLMLSEYMGVNNDKRGLKL